MELWIFYVGLVLLVGLFARFYSTETFADIRNELISEHVPEQAPERVYKPESWCLLSETVLGRTCVRSDACSASSRFSSYDACVLTEASALPLGISDSLHQFYRPFMSPNVQRSHTY
jgi:hypothetical protein